jgi:NAD-dependent dihydropyrimidine dehydrogenase PreA subunit
VVVQISTDDCTGCQVCIETCPTGVLALENDVCTVANPDECTDCGQCVEACPLEIISTT